MPELSKTTDGGRASESTRSAPCLRVQDLSVRYGPVAAVRGVSFAVSPGEIYGVLGPSGAGKSSILAALAGVVPSSGAILWGDENLAQLKPRERNIGIVYQEFRLFEWMTVFDNIAFPCRARAWTKGDIRDRVGATLTRMGLFAAADRLVAALSGGERQRVALARALVFEPRALLLDEPFSDVDPSLRELLSHQITEFACRTQTPVVLVTHDHDEAFTLCRQVALLFGGQIRQEGDAATLWSAPGNLEVAAFLGCANRLAGEVVAVEPGFVRVRSGRQEWLARADGAVLSIGTPVIAVCRPRAVLPCRDADGSINAFRGTIHSVNRSADDWVVTLSPDGGDSWMARWPASSSPTLQGNVLCRVDPSALLAFPS